MEGFEHDDAAVVEMEKAFETEIANAKEMPGKEAVSRGLEVLEAYQQRPGKFSVSVACAILRVALTRMPRPDFISAMTIIPDTFVCSTFFCIFPPKNMKPEFFTVGE